MRKKIFGNSFLICVIVLVLCAVLFVGAIYRYYETQVFAELASEASYAGHGIECSGVAYLQSLHPEARITWVDANGDVLYDTQAPAAEMENHAGREEIRQALETGTGKSVRDSSTLLTNTLYYALRLDDGTVLRVACQQQAVLEMLQRMIRPVLLGVLLALTLSAVFSYRLARRITGPINAMDLDYPNAAGIYPELQPLLTRLQQQNETIGSQMQALRRSQQEFTAITENMREGFLLVDAQTNVLAGNHQAMQIFGAADGLENLRRCDCPQLQQTVAAALAGQHGETLLVRDGVSWQVLTNPVRSNGQLAGAVIIVVDVTEREQREQLRREFSANVSHELKTPLTSISGFAELMRSGMVPMDKVQEFSGDIYRESRRLIRLVEDIIQLSSLDEAAVPLERETVDLYDLADACLANLQPVAAKQHVTLQLSGTHETVRGVWQILNEMVYNLCDNAIKYNKPGGSVRVDVGRQGSHVQLRVADTGIGIPYAHQSRVFERFYRVDKSHSKQIGGTGLGLSIVKHGAQYHNARLALHSTPGQGTEITIVF